MPIGVQTLEEKMTVVVSIGYGDILISPGFAAWGARGAALRFSPVEPEENEVPVLLRFNDFESTEGFFRLLLLIRSRLKQQDCIDDAQTAFVEATFTPARRR